MFVKNIKASSKKMILIFALFCLLAMSVDNLLLADELTAENVPEDSVQEDNISDDNTPDDSIPDEVVEDIMNSDDGETNSDLQSSVIEMDGNYQKKRIRVGLIEPNASLSSCDISFDSAHSFYTSKDNNFYEFNEPIYSFASPASYTLKRLTGNCEISNMAFSNQTQIDSNLYPNYVPLIRDEAFKHEAPIKLINLATAFNAETLAWNDSSIVYVDAICGFQGDVLKFICVNPRAVLKADNDQPFNFYNSAYKGGISFYTAYDDGVSFFPINDLDLENYVKGVVPREMPTNWGIEAVKAQAVCARTYAISSLGNFAEYEYDVAPTIVSQVYGGVSAETENGNRAVEQTSHEELFYDGERVETFFHSNNGGFCASSDDVFSNELPYFKPKADPYSLQVTVPWYEVVDPAVLKANLDKNDMYIGDVLNMEILEVNDSKLIEKMVIYGTEGSVEMNGGKLRWLLGGNTIKSLYFKFIDDQSKIEEETKKRTKDDGEIAVLTADGLQKEARQNLTYIDENGEVKEVSEQAILTASGAEALPSSDWVPYEGGKPGQTGMIVVGYGWGHNLGLSQWGAKVMAEEGFNYKEILNFYYEGTEIAKN